MKAERRGGNYGAGTKEIQARNYVTRKENERKRRELFEDARPLLQEPAHVALEEHPLGDATQEAQRRLEVEDVGAARGRRGCAWHRLEEVIVVEAPEGASHHAVAVVLPERAVHPATWAKVVAGLSHATPPAR